MSIEIDKLTEQQRALFFNLTLLQQEVVLRVLDGMTWKEAYEDCPDTKFNSSSNGYTTVRRSHAVRDFMNSVRWINVLCRALKRLEC